VALDQCGRLSALADRPLTYEEPSPLTSADSPRGSSPGNRRAGGGTRRL